MARQAGLSRGVIIGAIITLITGVLIAVSPEFFKTLFSSDKKKVIIESVTLVEDNTIMGLDIVVKSLSDKPQNLVILNIGIGQMGSQIATIDKSTYKLSDKLTFKIDGKSKTTYQATGQLEENISGKWSLQLYIPVREELQAQKTKSIILFLPNIINLQKANSAFSISSETVTRYIEGRSANKLKLIEFLKGKGESTLNITMQGSTGTTLHNSIINFNK